MLRLCVVRASICAVVLLLNLLDLLLTLVLGVFFFIAKIYSKKDEDKKTILVVGGSFAGLHVQRALSHEFDVVLIDYKEYFEYTPGILRCFCNPAHFRSIAKPLPSRRNRLIVAQLVELRQGTAIVSNDDVERKIKFDVCVLATGSKYPCKPITATLAETDLLSRQQSWDEAAKELREASTVIVLGGGPVGVELAAEIASVHRSMKVTLVTSGGSLCSNLPVRIGTVALAWLKSHRVDVRFHSRVEKVVTSDDGGRIVWLYNGQTLHADIVYECMGNGKPNSEALCAHLNDSLDVRGRIAVGHSLQLAHSQQAAWKTDVEPMCDGSIFAIGDVMYQTPCVPNPYGDELKLGHTAELNADAAALNVRHYLRGEQVESYPWAAVGADVVPRVFCVSLGESYGVMAFNGLVLSGWVPAVAKAVIEWTKVAACAERPVGILIWKFGDYVTNWISRKMVLPPPKALADDKES